MSESWPRRHPSLVITGVAGSVLLSLWTLTIDGIINNDGVHYILTAELIARGEWTEALETFKWPAYSFLIYLVQLLPGVDYESAAHVVTTAGFTLVVLAMVDAVHALGGRGRVLWLALAVILAYPGINEIRSYLIRDAVFLALYLFALAALLRHDRSGRLGQLVLSACCLLVAALFRVEALMIAALLPALVALGSDRARRHTGALVVYILAVVPALALFYGWWIFRPDNGEMAWTGLAEPWQVFQLAAEQVLDEFYLHLEEAGLSVGITGVLSGLGTAAWLVVRQTLEAVSLPYTVIILVEVLRRRVVAGFTSDQRRLLGWVIVLHLVVLFAFASVKFFLTPRYPVALAVTLVLAVPFALDRYLASLTGMTSAFKRRLAGAGLGLLIVANGVEGLDNFSDKFYLRDAAIWLREHAGSDYRLASNDLKFAFYADRYDEKWVVFRDAKAFRQFLLTGKWKWKDYVAVNIRHSDADLDALVARTLRQAPVRRFDARNGDRLLIFYTGDN